MAQQDGVYKCNVCGNVVSVLEAHGGTLVCCGKDMILQQEKTAALEGKEKHVPVVEIKGKIVKVKVGSIPHPMEEKHFIELIQLLQNGHVIAEKRLKPGQPAEAEFTVADTKGITAREYCNLHGLWKN
jgi:superoxide reductase